MQKFINLIWLGLVFTWLLTGCNLEKDIDIDLPPYQSQMVVECYIEPGQPIKLSLVESNSYLDAPDIKLIEDAEVIIYYNGSPINLNFEPSYDKRTKKYYTHTTRFAVPGQPGDVYSLDITDKKGRSVSGSTTILPVVKIDTVEFNFNDKEKALVLTRFRDSAATENYYRYAVHKDSLNHSAEVEYASPDELNNGKPFAFGTGYDFEPGDTVFVSLFHIDKEYYDFRQSVEDAQSSNGNPFAQPGRVKSTVQGGLGVFTNIVFDRKLLIVPKK